MPEQRRAEKSNLRAVRNTARRRAVRKNIKRLKPLSLKVSRHLIVTIKRELETKPAHGRIKYKAGLYDIERIQPLQLKTDGINIRRL
jgi:hypothetical protein